MQPFFSTFAPFFPSLSLSLSLSLSRSVRCSFAKLLSLLASNNREHHGGARFGPFLLSPFLSLSVSLVGSRVVQCLAIVNHAKYHRGRAIVAGNSSVKRSTVRSNNFRGDGKRNYAEDREITADRIDLCHRPSSCRSFCNPACISLPFSVSFSLSLSLFSLGRRVSSIFLPCGR